MMLIRGRKSSYAVVKQTGNLTAGFTCLVSLSQTEIHMHILDLILDMIIGGDEEEDVKWREIRLQKCIAMVSVICVVGNA